MWLSGGCEDVVLEPDRSRDASLCPYRSLDPERLKLLLVVEVKAFQ